MTFDPLIDVDHVVTDPAYLDLEYPPEHFMTHFMSQGSVVHAYMWIAQGRDPKGCVIICPQAFGGDRLESLIIPLLSSGISVMTYNPRGMWDGVHEYTSISALDDACAAVEFLHRARLLGKTTKLGHDYRIDVDRIVCLGLSGGGGTVSLAACAALDSVRGAVGIAPSNHEPFRNATPEDVAHETLNWVKEETAGRVDTVPRVLAMTDADIDRTSVIHNVPKLLSKPVLLIGADRDTATPLATCHVPIAQAFREAKAQNFTEVIMETDHLFLTKRIALARLVISWLRSECGM